MANNKQRYINTRFWNDSWVAKLDPIEKLLFAYFLTNEHTNISGVYELPLKIMAVETGIDESMFKKIIPRLKEKIRYIEGIVVIKNFIKHQETGSPNVQTGILNCLKELNINFLKNIVRQGYFNLPKFYLDTLCIGYVEGRNYLDSDLDLDLDSIAETAKGEILKQIKEEEWDFKKYLEGMEENKRRDLPIIALYWKFKKFAFTNKKQAEVEIKRSLRAAKDLEPFEDEKIWKTMDWLSKNADYAWKLETVGKFINEKLSDLKIKR